MNYAVLTYAYVNDKPNGIPDLWPSQTIELGDGTDLPGENWILMTSDELSTYMTNNLTEYNTWATSHYAKPINTIVKEKIESAIEYGNNILIQFATENVMMGITQSGKTSAIVNYLTHLRGYISTGSLYSARDELIALIADPDLETNYAPFLTVSRLTSYKQKLEEYLGI